MTRNPRLYLILVMAAVLVLVSVPFASARPLVGSQVVERTVDGWIGAAVRWVEGLVGFHRPSSGHTTTSPEPIQKDGNGVMGGSCIDPVGNPCAGR